MEYKAAFVVFLAAFIAGISVLIFRVRRHGKFAPARKEYARFLQAHLLDGTLVQQLEAIAEGTVAIHQPKRSWKLYLRVAASMIVGVAVMYLIARFTPAGVVIRTIVGILVILPFVYYIAVGIAEEFDENRIAGFERVTSRQLLEKSQHESIDNDIKAMAE